MNPLDKNITIEFPDENEKNIDLDDNDLVRLILQSDNNAMAQLITRYQVSVYNLCRRMLHNQQEAEDATQEVFLRVYQQIHTYNIDRKFSTWILSIAAHYSIDLIRRKRPVSDLEEIISWKASQDPDPEDMAVSGEEREEVREQLKKLPGKYRMVLVLRYWYDFSYEEISKATSLSISNVKIRLFRAREILAKQMAGSQPALKSSGKLAFGY
ncbi:sigma-70 family RNA polymerase sigma factor [Candidatus Chlorohelix sp.]|uniref:RNA polymerase sigma factor n=1 Tax=Candidatus Chlorohelix sp. TaxID=3139201 RepID=UPI0030501E07